MEKKKFKCITIGCKSLFMKNLLILFWWILRIPMQKSSFHSLELL